MSTPSKLVFNLTFFDPPTDDPLMIIYQELHDIIVKGLADRGLAGVQLELSVVEIA